MSESSIKGKSLEREVAKLIRQKLKANVERDPRSGAGDTQKSDIKDWYGELPFSVEVKNQKTLKVPEWWRQAQAAAGYRQPPALVFAMDNELLATVRLTDLLDLVAELAQQQATINLMRKPIASIPVVDLRSELASVTCRNGHIVAPGSTKCLAKGCPYSSSYKAKKSKEKQS